MPISQPYDSTAPIDTEKAKFGAGELRAIKQFIGGIPILAKAGNIVLALTDIGFGCLKDGAEVAGTTWTIPDNATVAFPVKTMISGVIEPGAGAVTLVISGTDTLYLAGTGATGARTLSAGATFTLWKFKTTKWIVSGTGVS